MEHFQDEAGELAKSEVFPSVFIDDAQVFFDRIDGELVLRALVIEVALKATWEIPYKEAWLRVLFLTCESKGARKNNFHTVEGC